MHGALMARPWSLKPSCPTGWLMSGSLWMRHDTRSGHGSKAGKQLEAFKSNYEDEKRQSLIGSWRIGLRREPKKRTKDGLTVCDVPV